MNDPTLTPELELQIIRLQLGVKQIERDRREREKLRIAEAQSGKGWVFQPIQVSDSKPVGQAGGVANQVVQSAPATLYFWTLAMVFVLGLITGFLVWGR